MGTGMAEIEVSRRQRCHRNRDVTGIMNVTGTETVIWTKIFQGQGYQRNRDVTKTAIHRDTGTGMP